MKGSAKKDRIIYRASLLESKCRIQIKFKGTSSESGTEMSSRNIACPINSRQRKKKDVANHFQMPY